VTQEQRDQLKYLMKIKKEKECKYQRPVGQYSLETKMPHEKKIEIGELILKEKILKKA